MLTFTDELACSFLQLINFLKRPTLVKLNLMSFNVYILMKRSRLMMLCMEAGNALRKRRLSHGGGVADFVSVCIITRFMMRKMIIYKARANRQEDIH